MKFSRFIIAFLAVAVMVPALSAGVLPFGDEDCLGQGCYGVNDPTAGATLIGLAVDTVTVGPAFGHGFPFTPGAGDFAGTDQIFVGSTQTGAHDGYSVSAERVNGPAVFVLDYSSLVASGQVVTSLTLGIAADDFQFPSFGQPFSVTLNGGAHAALTAEINSLNQGGPVVQFFTIGINPALLAANNQLTLAIDDGGDGGDGFAVDFLTVGVTTTDAGVPEPSMLALFGAGLAGLAGWARRRKNS